MRSLDTTITITADKKNRLNLKELWLFRELLYFFAWRDIKVRYKQTALGAGWAILQPLLAAGIFTLFFNRVAKIPSGAENIPYPLFAYLGITYWTSFSSALNATSNSVVGSQGVLTKIYFPRLLPPLAAIAVSIVDFCFAIAVFFLLLLGFRFQPDFAGLLMILPSLALIMITALGVGIFFAALNVRYRDVRSALPFIIQLGFFVTPVIYPLSMIPERFQIYAYLNPVAGALTSVKAALFDQPIHWAGLAMSWTVALVLVVIGVWYFKRTEKSFADII